MMLTLKCQSKTSQISGSSQNLAWHLRLAVFWERKASLTTDAVPVTVQIALRIMGIAMGDGIMDMTIHTVASLAGTKVEADCELPQIYRPENERLILWSIITGYTWIIPLLI